MQRSVGAEIGFVLLLGWEFRTSSTSDASRTGCNARDRTLLDLRQGFLDDQCASSIGRPSVAILLSVSDPQGNVRSRSQCIGDDAVYIGSHPEPFPSFDRSAIDAFERRDVNDVRDVLLRNRRWRREGRDEPKDPGQCGIFAILAWRRTDPSRPKRDEFRRQKRVSMRAKPRRCPVDVPLKRGGMGERRFGTVSESFARQERTRDRKVAFGRSTMQEDVSRIDPGWESNAREGRVRRLDERDRFVRRKEHVPTSPGGINNRISAMGEAHVSTEPARRCTGWPRAHFTI